MSPTLALTSASCGRRQTKPVEHFSEFSLDGGSIPPISTRLVPRNLVTRSWQATGTQRNRLRGFFVRNESSALSKEFTTSRTGYSIHAMPYVYMIMNQRSDLYTGISNNPNQRLVHHNTKQGAQFTKNTPDFAIVFLEFHSTLQAARQREIQIKKWRREKKEMLIERFRSGLPTKLSN